MSQTWTYRSRSSGRTVTGALTLSWGVSGSAISNDFIPSQISAIELFDRWVGRYGADNNGQPSIYWSAHPEGEAAPFQPEWNSDNFLTYWTHPTDSATGAPLNWLALPVNDKHWSTLGRDKGGFIQEATGWKPSALQPSVSAAALRAAADASS